MQWGGSKVAGIAVWGTVRLAALGHQDLIQGSAPVHATLAQPAAGADSLKDFRARRAEFF